MERAELNGLLLRARGLAVFRGVLASEPARNFLEILDLLAGVRPEPARVAGSFGRLWEGLAAENGRLLPDAWQAHLVGRLLDDENPFSLSAETGRIAPVVLEQARRDLGALRSLFDVEAGALLGALEDAVPDLAGVWVPWRDLEPEGAIDGDDPLREARRSLARKLVAADAWAPMAETLADHHAAHGAGLLGRYRAFRWEGGALRAVARPDGQRLSALIGQDREREPLVRNTERLLAGLPSHHALLYGPPGTGKSSTVKAIANEYAGEGLKLVEISKEDLGELKALLDVLRERRALRFVLFVDDLSFEEHEIEYKDLKALLEGSVEEPPLNVRVYATSNRRNLIRESFSDRGELGDDVHARDTMQEKLSLSARFGLRLTFPAPNQQRFLQIVSGLVRERGIGVPPDELRERALLWDRWHAGRSGRTARQFVDELEATLAGDPTEDPARSFLG